MFRHRYCQSNNNHLQQAKTIISLDDDKIKNITVVLAGEDFVVID